MKKMSYLDFFASRNYIRNIGIKTTKEWKIYSKNKRPSNIPSHPETEYKEKWLGFPDWLGYQWDMHKCPHSKKYSVNENFFKTWSHDMAYVLGFWFADGCIQLSNRRGATFYISQHGRNLYILKDILEAMGSNHPIRKSTGNNFQILISSCTIVNDIKNLGGKERKSLDVDFPNIPKKYLPDFVRGNFDGDGGMCVSSNKKTGANIYRAIFTTGSKNFCVGLFNALKNAISGLNGAIIVRKYKRNDKCGILYEISLTKNDAIRLRDFMYSTDSKLRLVYKYEILRSIGAIKQIRSGFVSYEDSSKFIRRIGIKTQTEWIEYCKTKERPYNIPSTPRITYKNKGWKSWESWVGTDKKD